MKKVYVVVILLFSVFTLTSCGSKDEYGEKYHTKDFDLLEALETTKEVSNAKVIINYPSALDESMILLIDDSIRYDQTNNEYFIYADGTMFMDRIALEDDVWEQSKTPRSNIIGVLGITGTVFHFAIADYPDGTYTMKGDYYILTGTTIYYEFEYRIRINDKGYIDHIQYYVYDTLNIELNLSEINEQDISLPEIPE